MDDIPPCSCFIKGNAHRPSCEFYTDETADPGEPTMAYFEKPRKKIEVEPDPYGIPDEWVIRLGCGAVGVIIGVLWVHFG